MKYLTVKLSRKDDLLGRAQAQLKREAMLVPPFMLFSASPELFAANWSLFREIFLVEKRVSREAKEAVNVAVSQINACPYCVDAHKTMLTSINQKETATAVVNRQLDRITNHKTRAVVEWALNSTRPGHPRLSNPPFDADEAPEIMGAAFQFHFINRLVNIFVGETFIPLPVGKGIASWLLTKLMRRKGVVGVSRRAGESLSLLPAAPLPEDFRWAAPNPAVAQAFARMARAVDEANNSVASDDARNFVKSRISEWNGEDKGISKKWVDAATDHLHSETRAFARLALLTAFSAYQIEDEDVSQFRTFFPTDSRLLAVTTWASFQAARRIINWTSLADTALSTPSERKRHAIAG